MITPLVTALIDTYNHERFIEEAISSVLGQDFPASKLEILVVDDGSTDKTPHIVRKFEPRVRLIRKTNGGQASAFNTGIPEARGEIIAFLDGDDWWAPNKISRVTEILTSRPNIGVLGHGYFQMDSIRNTSATTAPLSSCKLDFTSLDDIAFFRHMMSFFGTSRVVIRKKIALQALPVPESIVIEADEFLSILSIGLSGAFLLEDPLTYYRIHENNLYQLQWADHQKLRRMQLSLQALAQELPPRLVKAGLDSKGIRILVHTLENGARRLKLQLDGGMPWETFQVECADREFSYERASILYRLFACISLALTLVLPPRRFFQLRNWYASSRLRKWRAGIGEPASRIRIKPQELMPFPKRDSGQKSP